MKTDWEAIARQLWSDREVCGGLVPSEAKERWDKLVSSHTVRDESDLPASQWRWIRRSASHNWVMAYWNHNHRITDIFDIHTVVHHLYGRHLCDWNREVLTLEIGPRIEPPEDKL